MAIHPGKLSPGNRTSVGRSRYLPVALVGAMTGGAANAPMFGRAIVAVPSRGSSAVVFEKPKQPMKSGGVPELKAKKPLAFEDKNRIEPLVRPTADSLADDPLLLSPLTLTPQDPSLLTPSLTNPDLSASVALTAPTLGYSDPLPTGTPTFSAADPFTFTDNGATAATTAHDGLRVSDPVTPIPEPTASATLLVVPFLSRRRRSLRSAGRLADVSR